MNFFEEKRFNLVVSSRYMECTKLNIDIMGVSETHWPDSGQCKILHHTVYYSGNDNSQYRNGGGIVVSPRIQPTVRIFTTFSDRMMLLQLHATPFDVNVPFKYMHQPPTKTTPFLKNSMNN
ncbi:hypothetical protein HUJ04_004814 [Dendroctonus ponderosae]|nr:hypothetical protein HUJ04_004814 [Dendroctonus ponderosae]